MPKNHRTGAYRTWKQWWRHSRKGCDSFIEEDGEVINGWWWGFCNYCGCRHAKKVMNGKPVGPWQTK